MSNVQLPGSKTLDVQILMHFCTPKNDVSLSKQFQKHMSTEHHKHGVIDKGKYRKRSSKIKWTVWETSSVTYERARDVFRRCLALRSSNRQHQLWSPVEGLTSRTLLRECKGVPTRSLLHSLRAYKTLVREKRTAWELKTPT